MGTETHGAERGGGKAFEMRRFVNPARYELGQANMLANTSGQSYLAEIAHDHPEFERAEAAAQRGAVIHEVGDFIARAFRVTQVLGDEAKSGFDNMGLAGIKDAAIDGGEEPFVRVDDEGIGTFTARQHPAHIRINGSGAAIGGIDVQPQAVAFAYISDLGHRVDA